MFKWPRVQCIILPALFLDTSLNLPPLFYTEGAVSCGKFLARVSGANMLFQAYASKPLDAFFERMVASVRPQQRVLGSGKLVPSWASRPSQRGMELRVMNHNILLTCEVKREDCG